MAGAFSVTSKSQQFLLTKFRTQPVHRLYAPTRTTFLPPNSNRERKGSLFLVGNAQSVIKEAAVHDSGVLSALSSEVSSSQRLLDFDGLKSEVSRQQARATKKVSKATDRLRKAEKKVEELLSREDLELQELESCPDTDALKAELEALKARLRDINGLKSSLDGLRSAADAAYPAAVDRALALGISDRPPPRPQRGPKKAKAKPPPPRKPYHVYSSADGVEIRVGRGASDNDELSCNATHRDALDWWMHVSGFPGSHVVIRYQGEEIPHETLLDAATLAAVKSKAPQNRKAKVSLVRCRQVAKPLGAKPGLVRLSGEISKITVDVRNESSRLERLEGDKAAANSQPN